MTETRTGRSTQPPATRDSPEPNNMDQGGDDDGTVRCICGFEEVPKELLTPDSIDLVDDEGRPIVKSELPVTAEIIEDLAGFFLQCDTCQVWQHGACVGIIADSQSPDNYYCEECRKDLHSIRTRSNGVRYSRYLPAHPDASRASSRAASFGKEGTRSPRGSRNGRPSSAAQQSAAKRRSTMNSRDAAYDEDEQLRRAIEASKGENKSGESADGGTVRRGKRDRSNSDEDLLSSKRQRTTSDSPTPPQNHRRSDSQNNSDDETAPRNGKGGRIRGAAARNHREKEMREDKERQRIEAANKRKGRAERRRIDDSSEEQAPPPKEKAPSVEPPEPPVLLQPSAPDSPPAVQPQTTSHRKGGRPPNARKGKLGKNQYTKDKDDRDGSPSRSQSRDIDSGHTINTRAANAEAKVGRSKGHNMNKVSMADLKRRVTNILDFITRTQVEMAEDSSPFKVDAGAAFIKEIADSVSDIVNVNGGGVTNGQKTEEGHEKEFKNLTCVEMMDVLTRELMKWKEEFT